MSEDAELEIDTLRTPDGEAEGGRVKRPRREKDRYLVTESHFGSLFLEWNRIAGLKSPDSAGQRLAFFSPSHHSVRARFMCWKRVLIGCGGQE